MFMRNDLNYSPAMITANDHVDAWMQFMRHALEQGRRYEITSGSHAGGFRLSLDSAHCYIRYPETRPLYPLGKEGLINPVGKVMVNGREMDEIEHYFHHYVLNPHGSQPNEHYNYSEWLYPLAHLAIDYYAEKGFGNAHAVLRVGDPFCFRDYFRPYSDETSRPTTPCLLGIDTRIVDGKEPGTWFLMFWVNYRSWDLYSGFLTNLGGFQLLKEYMAEMISSKSGKRVRPGPTFATCKDLHLYGHHIEAAKAWLGI
jgi:hypothetical protein